MRCTLRLRTFARFACAVRLDVCVYTLQFTRFYFTISSLLGLFPFLRTVTFTHVYYVHFYHRARLLFTSHYAACLRAHVADASLLFTPAATHYLPAPRYTHLPCTRDSATPRLPLRAGLPAAPHHPLHYLPLRFPLHSFTRLIWVDFPLRLLDFRTVAYWTLIRSATVPRTIPEPHTTCRFNAHTVTT